MPLKSQRVMKGDDYLDREKTRLSRTIALALRHEPWRFDLEPDEQGWVDIKDLLAALKKTKQVWANLTEADLAEMIASSDKKRFEIDGGRIRALYGHSTLKRIEKTRKEPPEFLYHGTHPEVVPIIKAQGLRPMARQYVHLSADQPTALQVGRRRTKKPAILRILALKAHRTGVLFYEGNDKVWLADDIPAEFIEFPRA